MMVKVRPTWADLWAMDAPMLHGVLARMPNLDDSSDLIKRLIHGRR